MKRKRILLPSSGPDDWRAFLGDPVKHWKQGRSAFEIAYAWESAQTSDSGLPSEVAAALDEVESLRGAELLVALPEHKVTLDTDRAPSQNDLWALLANDHGLISLAVEGKAGESFDATVQDWLEKDDRRTGRENRLAWLCAELGRGGQSAECGALRYQLFHRTVSALKEARRCRAASAVMLVQTFCDDPVSWADYERFACWLGAFAVSDGLCRVPMAGSPALYLGWVTSSCARPERVAGLAGSRILETEGLPG